MRVAARAEQQCLRDPVASLVHQRTLAEMLAREAAAYAGVRDAEDDQYARLQALEDDGILPSDVARLFHRIRTAGNGAAHRHEGTAGEALHHLKLARGVAVWFHRTFDTAAGDFHPGRFVPPSEQARDAKISEDARQELERLRSELSAAEDEVAASREAASAAREAVSAERDAVAEERQHREQAEQKAQQLYDDLTAAEDLLGEAEEAFGDYEARLTELRAQQEAAPADERAKYFARSAEAAGRLNLDEADTRALIDEQLRAAGWDADTRRLRHSRGARPQKGVSQAIAEWPTASGPADYVLFAGLTPLAIVEAKKYGLDVAGRVGQAERYARDYVRRGEEEMPGESPWSTGGARGDYRLPFVFASNGRPYLKQLETKSGVWFRDARRAEHHARALSGFYTPEGLKKLLAQDIRAAEEQLRDQPVDLAGLRYYQVEAIRAAEEAIAEGRAEMLVAMATGTGKTRTALGLLYRLIKFGRFRRVLFLVDRTTLGEQAEGTFEEVKVEGTYAFADVYDVKVLGDLAPESDTRLHIATVQGMARRVLRPSEGETSLPADQYDCIVVDECHRGYTLDRELSDTELTFRDQGDYLSAYRRVIEHFDAVRIGLTATPALHTVEIFGDPIYEYSYRRAVIDGYLVDHEPPFGIVTELAADGIHWSAGDELKQYDPETSTIELTRAPDEIDVDIERFNTLVITENFNRAVIGRLAGEIDPFLPGKTLVFCVTDEHADLVVRLFKKAFEAAYGEVRDDAVAKITGAADRPQELIRHFRNEEYPKVAVTVDLLTTGVDVKPITNLVFLRRVKSRILYEQMLGRATRLCPDLYGPGEDKEAFRIFDAVQLYDALQEYSDMKPVVRQPSISFVQLAAELEAAERDTPTNEDARRAVAEQFQAKLHRKRGALESAAGAVEQRTGYAPADLLAYVREDGAEAIAALLGNDPELPSFLDDVRRQGPRRRMISDHSDAVRETHSGYGKGNMRPEAYLDGFRRWVRAHEDEVAALQVVTQRPRELTREDLKALRLRLDREGFTELQLRRAWGQARNQDIAAGIIGFIRAQALGSPLVPYAERVDRAVREILSDGRASGEDWTGAQRQWLRRIAKQIKENTIVDRAALDEPPFKNRGGFRRIDKVFGGQLMRVIGDVHEAVWQDRREAA